MTLEMPSTSRYGQAIIGTDTPAICPAWWFTPLTKLVLPPAVVWNNRDDGEAGRTAFDGIWDQTSDSFSLIVVGGVDMAGTPYDDPEVGLFANIDDLTARIGQGLTLNISFTPPGGLAVRTGQIQFGRFEGDPKGAVLRTTLPFVLPRGRLAEAP